MDREETFCPEALDMEALRRAWDRAVPGEGPEPEPPEAHAAAVLAPFIRSAQGAGALYALLALKTRGAPAERVLRTLTAAEAETERRLQTEHLLLTGDTLPRRQAHPSAPYVTRALREAHAAELTNADRYDTAAGELTDQRLRSLCQELAATERRHAAMIRGMLEGMIR